MSNPCKVQRTESVAVIPTPAPEETAFEAPESHPRKTPQAISSSESPVEGSNPPTTLAPSAKARNGYDIAEDIIKKLRKENGTYDFIPLSCGRGMSDVYWEVTGCKPMESKRSSGWFLISVRVYVDCGGDVLLHQNTIVQQTFKVDINDLMKICYLRMILYKQLFPELTKSFETPSLDDDGISGWVPYDNWEHLMLLKMNSSTGVTPEVALSIYKKVFEDVDEYGRRLPPGCKILFSKRPLGKVVYPPGVFISQDRNSVTCDGGKGFKYVIRVRIFFTDVDREGIKVTVD